MYCEQNGNIDSVSLLGNQEFYKRAALECTAPKYFDSFEEFTQALERALRYNSMAHSVARPVVRS